MTGPARSRFPSLVHALAGFFMLIHCSFPVSFHVVLTGTGTVQNPLFNAVYLLAVTLVWCHATTYQFSLREWLRSNWVLLLVPALAAVSLIWSVNRPQTLHKSLLWLVSTLTLLRVCHQMGFRDFLRMLAWTLACVNLLCLVTILFLPDLGTYTTPWVNYVMWRGPFSHKNYMARVNLCSLLLFLMLMREKPLVWGLHSLVAGILLVGSRSGTNLGTAGMLLLYEAGYWGFRQPWSRAHKGLLQGLCAGGIAGVAALAGPILDLAGKDWTLTGRTVLFLQAMLMIARKPLLGYGYRAFWGPMQEGGGRVDRELQGALTWVPPHSHNSFLDLSLDLGLVGLVAGCLFLGLIYLRARELERSDSPGLQGIGHFAKVILLWTVITSMVETFLYIDTFQWLLMVALGEYLGMGSKTSPDPAGGALAPGLDDP